MKFNTILRTGFLTTLIMYSTSAFSQQDSGEIIAPKTQETLKPQVEKPKPKPVVKDSVKVTPGKQKTALRTIIGWVKSTDGKWLSSPNRIPFDDNDYNNEYYEKYRIGIDNISQLQVIEMKVDNKPYYALIQQYVKGYYKDVEKQEDWKYFTAADYYLIEKKQFKQFMQDSTGFTKPRTVSLRSHYTGTVPYTSGTQIAERIGKDININLQTRHLYDTTVHTYYQFALKPVKNKNGAFMRFLTGIGYSKGDAMPPEADYDLFARQYYQTEYSRFKQFMSLLQ